MDGDEAAEWDTLSSGCGGGGRAGRGTRRVLFAPVPTSIQACRLSTRTHETHPG